jgi:lysophospholipase L1-like esterase
MGMAQRTSKLWAFAVIANVLLLLLLESGARVFLSIRAHSLHFLSYGLTSEDALHMKQFVKVMSSDGTMLYYKGVPSQDAANPVNSLGWRGEEISADRKGSIRVVCLGGSTTYGSGLPYKDTFPKLLQDTLDRHCGKNRYEVMNAGQPAFNLHHIINMTNMDVLPLNPDIVIVMSVINNFLLPGESTADTTAAAVKDFIVNHFCIGLIVHDLLSESHADEFIGHLGNFNWARFAHTILSSPAVWSAYERNLNNLIECIRRHNPSTQFIILEQPFNSSNFPEMQEPYRKALGIMTETADAHENSNLLHTQMAIMDATHKGKKIWQAPHIDPVHLLRGGNEILAALVHCKLNY